jgi:hypothetical protein
MGETGSREWLRARESVMYRLLLLLYPSSFRAEYGEEMCRDFARKRQQASGFFALAVLWLDAIGTAFQFPNPVFPEPSSYIRGAL